MSNRARILLIPMVVWSAIYVVMAWTKIQLTSEPVAGLEGVFDSGWSLLNAITGFAGPTANYTLFFIRDLFVTIVLLRFLAPALRSAGYGFLIIALAMKFFQIGAPFIFRPDIFLFATAGAIWALQGQRMSDLSQRPVMISGLFIGIVLYASPSIFNMEDSILRDVLVQASDLGRRILMTLLISGAAFFISERWANLRIERLGGSTYLSYLLHIPFIGLLWVIWNRTIGNQFQDSYLFFYMISPFLSLAVGFLIGKILDKTPSLIQLLLRGKISKP